MSEYLQESIDILKEADLICSQQEIEASITRMAGQITERLGEKNPIIMTVMNGGLVLGGVLLPQLAFPLTVDYIHATRYGQNTSGGELDWKVRPHQSLQDRVVILVDDIFDEGLTLEAIISDCLAAGAAEVYSAVLVEKIRHRPVDLKMDFVGLKVEDRYLFGYGMDYKGYLRNAAGIYAVKGM